MALWHFLPAQTSWSGTSHITSPLICCTVLCAFSSPPPTAGVPGVGLEPRVRCSAPPEHCREHPLKPTGCVTLKHLGSPWHSSPVHHILHYWRYCAALTHVSELVPFLRTSSCSPLPRKATSATGGPRPQLWPLLSGHELPLKSQPDWAGAQKGRAMQRSQHHQGSLLSARPAPSELSLFLSASRSGSPKPT